MEWFIQIILILFIIWLFFVSIEKWITENALWFIVTIVIVFWVFYFWAKSFNDYVQTNYWDKNTIMENWIYLNY